MEGKSEIDILLEDEEHTDIFLSKIYNTIRNVLDSYNIPLKFGPETILSVYSFDRSHDPNILKYTSSMPVLSIKSIINKNGPNYEANLKFNMCSDISINIMSSSGMLEVCSKLCNNKETIIESINIGLKDLLDDNILVDRFLMRIDHIGYEIKREYINRQNPKVLCIVFDIDILLIDEYEVRPYGPEYIRTYKTTKIGR